MLGTFYGEICDRFRAPARADGGTTTARPSPAEPRLPPSESFCPDDACGGETELVAVADLLESEDIEEWATATALDARGIDVARRCTVCGTVHETE